MKIILAIDGSKYSDWAMDLLLKLPLVKEPEILVMHVVDLAMFAHPLMAPSIAEEHRAAMRKAMDERLEMAHRLTGRVVEKIKKRWKKVRPLIEEGRAAERIVTRAREEDSDLILLGSRGISNVRGFLLGSVSQKVATYAPCSVLVVKRRIRAVKRFLLAVDGSKSSEAAMRFMQSHFIPEPLQGTVLYVWDYPIHPHPESLMEQMIEERHGEPLKRAGFKTKTVCVMGQAAAKIVRMASDNKADLVVVGSRGLTGLKRFFLGGISHKVVRYSHESVLVVR